jgi:ankyrin repeat protein
MVNDDRYSALLFASFKGSIPIIEMLLDIGADMHHCNSFGINVCHVAAQGRSTRGHVLLETERYGLESS